MEQKTINHILATAVFSIGTVIHLLRIIFSWEAMVGSWKIPMWLSWIGVVLFGYLAYTAFRQLK